MTVTTIIAITPIMMSLLYHISINFLTILPFLCFQTYLFYKDFFKQRKKGRYLR